MKDIKILVLGGGGLVGTRLSQILIEKYGANLTLVARNLYRFARASRYPFNFIKLDVADQTSALKALCDQHQIVVDLTFVANGDRKSRISDSENIANNISHAASSCEKIIHLSSISAYGNIHDAVLDENTQPVKSKDPYSAAKLAAETIFLNSKNSHKTVVLQPTVIYGPWSGWSTGAISQMQGSCMVLPTPIGQCHAVFIDDVVYSIIAAMQADSSVCENKYLISNPEKVTWDRFFTAHCFNNEAQGMIELLDKNEMLKLIKCNAQNTKAYKRLLYRVRSDASIRNELMGTIGLDTFFDLVRKKSSFDSWTKVKNSFGILDPAIKATNIVEIPKIYPDQSLMDLYQTPFKANVKKAKLKLNFDANFSFEEGMNITKKWSNWFLNSSK